MIVMLIRPALALLALGCGSLSACGADDGGEGSSDTGLTVVTTVYPLAYLVEQVAGSEVSVTTLTSPGQEPHDLELGVQQIAEMAEADLVVYSEGFQPAVDEGVQTSEPTRVLDVSAAADLAGVEEHPDEHAEDEEDHAHGDEDPHFWLDPQRMADVATAVADVLAEVRATDAEEYQSNAAQLGDRLGRLDGDYRRGLADCRTTTAVVSHDAFGYLERYGLHFEAIAGLSPGAEPSPARLAELQDLVRSEGVSTVFYETLVSADLARTLAEEAGVTTAVLDPIEGLTDETADEDYLSLMRSNLEALRQAGGCR